jgi:hypothetical protein
MMIHDLLAVCFMPVVMKSRTWPCSIHLRLLTLAMEKVRESGEFAEAVISAMLDAVMGTAVDIIKSAQRSFAASA